MDTVVVQADSLHRLVERIASAVGTGAQAADTLATHLVGAELTGVHTHGIFDWTWELQRFANPTRLSITVCHYAPGTSKWNRIEHRLFSYIALNWRGEPLVSWLPWSV